MILKQQQTGTAEPPGRVCDINALGPSARTRTAPSARSLIVYLLVTGGTDHSSSRVRSEAACLARRELALVSGGVRAPALLATAYETSDTLVKSPSLSVLLCQERRSQSSLCQWQYIITARMRSVQSTLGPQGQTGWTTDWQALEELGTEKTGPQLSCSRRPGGAPCPVASGSLGHKRAVELKSMLMWGLWLSLLQGKL